MPRGGVSIFEQIAKAYAQMESSGYKPDADIHRYAQDWWEAEDDRLFLIGCCNYPTRIATIYAIEAARNMCSGVLGNRTALALLKLAVKEIEKASK